MLLQDASPSGSFGGSRSGETRAEAVGGVELMTSICVRGEIDLVQTLPLICLFSIIFNNFLSIL